jgi:hypothetical protein
MINDIKYFGIDIGYLVFYVTDYDGKHNSLKIQYLR